MGLNGVRFALCVAATGTTTRGAAGLAIAPASFRGAGATFSVFASFCPSSQLVSHSGLSVSGAGCRGGRAASGAPPGKPASAPCALGFGAKPQIFLKPLFVLMQIKLFTIPIMGGETLMEDLNIFLRSKKILQVENRLLESAEGNFWCFCIKYLDSSPQKMGRKEKVDYKQLLDEASFARFSKLRAIRKKVANEEAIPAFAVFTDKQLAGLAKQEKLSLASMQEVKGVGKQKVEKYGRFFVEPAPSKQSE